MRAPLGSQQRRIAGNALLGRSDLVLRAARQQRIPKFRSRIAQHGGEAKRKESGLRRVPDATGDHQGAEAKPAFAPLLLTQRIGKPEIPRLDIENRCVAGCADR